MSAMGSKVTHVVSVLILTVFLFSQCSKNKGSADVKLDRATGTVALTPEQQPPPLTAPEQDAPRVPVSTAVSELKSLTVYMTQADTPGGDMTFTFNLPVVAEDSLKTSPIPNITFSPEIKGTFTWKSETVLLFTPARDAISWGQSFIAEVDSVVPLAGDTYTLHHWEGEYTAPYFRMAGKVASWPVYRGKPRFVSFLNWRSGQIGKGPLLLLYDQEFTAKAALEKITVLDAEGAPLEIRKFRPDSIAASIDSSITPKYCIAVELVTVPDEGTSLTMQIPSWEGKDAAKIITRELMVKTSFATVRWGDEEYSFSADNSESQQRTRQLAPLDYEWTAVFDNNFSLATFKKALRIEPNPESIVFTEAMENNYTTGYYAPAVTLSFKLKPGTTYKLSIPGEFTDVLGNDLSDPIHTWFRTADLVPSLELPVKTVFIEQQQSTIPVQVRNIKALKVSVFSWKNQVAFAEALLSGRKKNMKEYGISEKCEVLSFTYQSAKNNSREKIDIPLGDRTGLFCIEVTAMGTGSKGGAMLTDATLLQRGNTAVTAKVLKDRVFTWVTRLSDGMPEEGVRLQLFDGEKVIGSAKTGADGTATIEASGIATACGLKKTVAVIAEKDSSTTVVPLINEQMAQPWQFGIKGAVEGFEPLFAEVFTERGVYRPGDSVYVKIIAGVDDAGKSSTVQVEIKDSRGQQVLKKEQQLDDYHATHLAFQLKDQAPVGTYAIHVSKEQRSTACTFSVEEYRVPTFKVKVESDAKEWQLGSRVEALISAAYLHGGTLDGREVRWEILRKDAAFAPGGFEKYHFSFKEYTQSGAGTVVNGSKRLNGQGQLLVDFTPNHASAMGPMLYTVEATVTDVDRQAYAGRIAKTVHPADYYLGVKPPSRSVIRQGEVITIPVVALDTDAKVVSGIKVHAVLERVDYHTAARVSDEGSVDMINRPVTAAVDYKELTTGETPVPYTLQTPSAGSFRLRIWSKDRKGRVVQTGFSFTASGNNVTAWPRFDQDIIEVVADKQEYMPGDVAQLVVQSPYKNAHGLLTIEGDGWIESKPIEIRNNTPSIAVPITDRYSPNVFVSIMLVRGRMHDEKDALGFETGAPGFKIGYHTLNVLPVQKRLEVVVAPDRTVAQPGEKMKVSFSVKDFGKNPSESRIACMIVDEAVLGLTGYTTPDPVSSIFAKRFLSVRTGTSILDLPFAKRSRFEKIFPGGDQDKAKQGEAFSETLRKLFKSTAYWNPDIKAGADGKASVTVDLPDNLTTYRIMAVAFDKKGRVGSSDQKVTIKQPLMIQAVLPRFVYPGDQLQIEALVYNGTQSNGNVTVGFSCSGVELLQKTGSVDAEVKADGSRSFPFSVKVKEKGNAVIRFTASMGEVRDAVEVTIPVLEPGNRRIIVKSGSGEIKVVIPEMRIPGTAKMEVVVSNSALSELKDAVQYLMGYPNGCIEQTTSTAYPLVVLKDLLPVIGVKVDLADLKKFSEAGVRRILSFQTQGGGLSYWPGSSEPHAFATAFGLTALIAAKERGYDVPDKSLAGMADYLEAALRRGNITEDIPHGGMADGDTRALFVMTLGRLGRPQQAYISELWNKREKLTAFGLSFLAIAIKENPGDQSLLEPVLAEVAKAASQDKSEAWYDGSRKGGWSMDSPLRTHAAALLANASASNSLTPKYLAGLLKRRCDGMWGNTQENVFGIMGIHKAAVSGGGEDKDMGLQLVINGKTVNESEMERNSPQVRRISYQESDLALKSKGDSPQEITLKRAGEGVVYLTSRVQFDVPFTEENCKPQSNGFTMKRTYETMEGKSIEGENIALGSLVRVRLQLKTEAASHYVACDDKLPAGLEPLNTNLVTTERVAQGKLTNIEERSNSVLSYREVRDARVAFFIDEMLAGEYEYTYVARATTQGTFLRPAARVEAMYEPEKCGTTAIDKVTVVPKK